MNKIKMFLLAAILAVGILFPTATTLASPGTTVSVTNATLSTGATGSVALSISGATEPVSCIDVDVSYDPAVVEVSGVSGSDFNSLVDNIQNNLGSTRLVGYVTSETGLTGTIKVADIALKRLGGESALTLNVITLKDDEGNSIPFTVVNGRVAGPTGTTVSIAEIALSTGATGSVALSISGATEPVSCIDVDISYSSAVVEVLDATGSSFNSLTSNIQNSDGHTRLVGYVTSETGLTGTIKVADIALKRLGGESALTLNVITLKDDEGNSIPFTVVNGRVAATVPPTPGPGPGPTPTVYIETNLFGVEKSFRVNSEGKILETFEATSPDGILTIVISKNTIALGKDGKRLKSLEVVVNESPPDPPEDANIIGLAYDFGPDGATFEPPMTLTWRYDPDALPERVAEEDLVLAYYDEEAGKWIEIDCAVDTENNLITASVSHFTTFAIIGAITPAPPTPPVPPVPPAPAAFSVSNLSIQPLEVQPKATVTIAVTVANTGGEEGSYTVVLKINGVKEAEESITIAAGSSEIVTFSVAKEEVESYTVTVDGLSGSFTVMAPVPPPPPEEEKEVVPPPAKAPINWPVVGGIIAGVIVVGLLIFFFVRRRAY